MHFDFFAEGWKVDLDHMEEYLNTQGMTMTYTEPDGKKKTIIMPGALRPRRFYSYVFPKENLDIVLNTLKPDNFITRYDGMTELKDKITMGGFPLAMLRKALKLQPVPVPDPSKGTFLLHRRNVRIVGLGIREDVDIVNEKGNTQEAL